MPNPMAPAAIGRQGRQNRPPSQSTGLTLTGSSPLGLRIGGGYACTSREFRNVSVGFQAGQLPAGPCGTRLSPGGRRWLSIVQEQAPEPGALSQVWKYG
jgi:hypothetical protein